MNISYYENNVELGWNGTRIEHATGLRRNFESSFDERGTVGMKKRAKRFQRKKESAQSLGVESSPARDPDRRGPDIDHYRFWESSGILLTCAVVSCTMRSRIVGTPMRGIRPMERQDRGSCGYGLWCRVFAAERPREQRIMKKNTGETVGLGRQR